MGNICLSFYRDPSLFVSPTTSLTSSTVDQTIEVAMLIIGKWNPEASSMNQAQLDPESVSVSTKSGSTGSSTRSSSSMDLDIEDLQEPVAIDSSPEAEKVSSVAMDNLKSIA